ncbi:MAG: GHKL domain-containing protein [Eubacteriales bacterium]|nr:GHKL domain-containing protein [Eubacteriales bacterium]
MRLYDILRSIVTNAMLAELLFTLARPKYRPQTLWVALAAIVSLDLALNVFFYLRNDYTTLGKLDILFFILVGVAVKPLFRETLMQWLFNCLTAMNVYAITVILSYYLCGLFPYPHYAITVLRFLLFAAAILLFRKRLSPLYRQAAEHWSVYLFVAASLFLNFAWYFMASDDVVRTLTEDIVPLLLLVLLTMLVYLAIFLSLRKTLREAALREENLKMQSDRELTRQRLSLMDETVRQMSIVQHDRRHFNNTLLSLLRQGEADRAADLIRRQSEALPQKPQNYCQNVSVNAAVSYYAELARQRGVRCELRLDIPEKLDIDELSLAMTVSNLMENAITALSALPAEQRTLRFTAVNAGQLIFELSNPYDGEVALDENGLPISREEGHGKGTQSVADFVKKCGGELAYEISGGIFKVRLMV